MRAAVLALFCLLCAPVAPAAAQDLTMPAWTYCTPPGAPQLACFDQAGVQQLLRLQAAAQYGVRLNELRLTLEAQTGALVASLESAQASYTALQDVMADRNETLQADLADALAAAERYRGRLERRRVWPWVALGLGLASGFALGMAAGR